MTSHLSTQGRNWSSGVGVRGGTHFDEETIKNQSSQFQFIFQLLLFPQIHRLGYGFWKTLHFHNDVIMTSYLTTRTGTGAEGWGGTLENTLFS